jgi:two-component system OmpR family sensor kinase
VKQRSLRFRLVATVAALMAFGLVLFGAGTYYALQRNLLGQTDGQLDRTGVVGEVYIDSLPKEKGLPRFGNDDDGTAGGRLAENVATPVYLQSRGPDNKVFEELVRQGPRPDIPAVLPFEGERVVYFTVPDTAGDRHWRVRAARLDDGRGYLLIAQPTSDVDATLTELVRNQFAGGLWVLAGITVLGWWLVRRGMRPLDRIGDTARAIGDGDLSRRVEPAEDRTEVGRLGLALNAMLGQIEAAFAERRASEERLRRFIADASHELRTPLTSIRGYAEMFRRGAAADPDDTATAMRRIEGESARMAVLVDELLLLARLDEGRPLACAPVDLARLAEDAVTDAHAVEPDRPLRYERPPPITVLGDEARLRQVLANLLANVRQHTPAGTAAELRMVAAGGEVRIEVADEGPGLTPEQAGRVFERFYRTDPSRSRRRGGAGLGLAIVAATVAAHGGTAGVESVPGEGATFWVAMPLAGTARPTP